MPRYPAFDSTADSPETAESSLLTCSRDGTKSHIYTNPVTQICRRLPYSKRQNEDLSLRNLNIVQETKVQSSNTVIYQAPQRKRKKRTIDNYRDDDDFIVMYANEIDDTGYSETDSTSLLQNDSSSAVSQTRNFSSRLISGEGNCDVGGLRADDEENAVFTERRRLLVNSRERDRMKKLNEAMDRLRKVVPHYPSRKKLSKMETLLLAQNYILALTSLLQDGQSGEGERDAEKLAASITQKALKQEKLEAVNRDSSDQ